MIPGSTLLYASTLCTCSMHWLYAPAPVRYQFDSKRLK